MSGTRNEITMAQMHTLWSEIVVRNRWSEFHHGDCVGADKACHDAFRLFTDTKIVIHVPLKDDLRAFCVGDEERKPLSYFARNRNIVNETDAMLIIPYTETWQPKGGTWYTHDYAKKMMKPIWIIWPDGSLDMDEGTL